MKKRPSFAALIELLKARNDHELPKDWAELEEHVKRVYQTLLELDGERAVVARNVLVQGRDGGSYQIDVYYEFELAKVRHRVAIECKNTKRAVERKDVLAFKAVLDDCLGMQGVIVSMNGFQQGAKDFASANGLIALSVQDLPSLGNILGMRLETVLMPAEATIGEPFWSIYELETFAPLRRDLQESACGVLFYSKEQANEFFVAQGLSESWVVRGLNKNHLGSFILTVDSLNGRYAVAIPPHLQPDTGYGMAFSLITREDLIRTYCEGSSLPPQPMVMPSLK